MRCCQSFGEASRYLVAILALAGVAFSVLTYLSCEFFKFEDGTTQWFEDLEDELEANNSTLGDFTTSGTVGMFEADLLVGCAAYPDGLKLDNYIKAAQYGSVLAMGFGSLGLLLVLVELFFCNKCGKTNKILVNLVFFLAYACQGMTFAIFGTEDFCRGSNVSSCSLGLGGIYSIVAFSLYMVCSCAVCCLPQHDPVCCRTKTNEDFKQTQNELSMQQVEEEGEGDPYGSGAWSGPSVTTTSTPTNSSTPNSAAAWSDPLESPATQSANVLPHWSTVS